MAYYIDGILGSMAYCIDGTLGSMDYYIDGDGILGNNVMLMVYLVTILC